MKNINYDLLKMMHAKLDAIWRLEKFYINDANVAKCHSKGALEKILEDEREHVKMLHEEIRARMNANIFD